MKFCYANYSRSPFRSPFLLLLVIQIQGCLNAPHISLARARSRENRLFTVTREMESELGI